MIQTRIALLVAAATIASAQVALPFRPAGVYLIGGPSSTVQIEAFVDPFCGDAKQEYFMWTDVKASALAKARLTEKDVGVVFKLIVEPFHPWSWTASVGAYTAAAHGGSEAFFNYLGQCWNHGHDFITQWGSDHYQLANMTETDAVRELATFAANAGVDQAAFYNGMTNRSTNAGGNPWAVARSAWKEAVSRGAASSPWYFVNGVPFFASSDSLHQGEDGWLGIIQKLVEQQNAN